MIELKHVSFAYQGQEHDGLHDINLTIADGECVLFCGRSGCGKTTITRLVNGLIPQFYAGELTGSVLVDGQEISKLPMYQIAAKVGSVFQTPGRSFSMWTRTAKSPLGLKTRPGRPWSWRNGWSRPPTTCISARSETAISLNCPGRKAEDRLRLGLCHESGDLPAG